jgi:hypothetical protein
LPTLRLLLQTLLTPGDDERKISRRLRLTRMEARGFKIRSTYARLGEWRFYSNKRSMENWLYAVVACFGALHL